MPSFVRRALIRLLPVTFILTIFEIVGLLSIIPVIQILIRPQIIHENSILKIAYRWVGPHDDVYFVLLLLGLSVFLFGLKNLIIYWASLRQTAIVYDTASRLTQAQFENYLYQPYKNHVESNTSVLLRKIIEVPYNFSNGIMLPMVQFINEVLITTLIIAVIFVYNTLLFLSMILFITPFLLLYIRIYRTQLNRISINREEGHTEMFKQGRQSIEGFREIWLFNRFGYFMTRFRAAVYGFSNAMARIYHLSLFSPKIIETLAIFCVFGIFLTGILLGYELHSLVSFLATFAIAAYRLIPSVNKIIYSYNSIKSSEFVFEHFRSGTSKSEFDREDFHKEVKPLPFQRSIEVRNISFSFHEERKLLHNVSFSLNRGEMVGIIGKSGSGKSTLINIILGLFEPDSGSIYVDGIRLNNSNRMNWHRTISFVPQNPVLIDGSIVENIAFGVEPAIVDYEKIEWCIAKSGLKDYVDQLPNGLETGISDKSLNISGGQRQRLAIARALYHEGKILIFDEATSSLDAETENLLTESIRGLAEQSYTIIIIAHRTASLKYCNRIYSISAGKISEPLNYSDIL